MCTYPPGKMRNTIFNISINQTHDSKLLASDIYFSNALYQFNDYRCLKPGSHEHPAKWHTYQVEGYRRASSKEMLNDVQTFPYNMYMYNLEDPEILRFAGKSDKNARKYWRRGYGVYFATRMPDMDRTADNAFLLDYSECTEKCTKIEKSKFAKRCRKNGGYFKCCVFSHAMGKSRYVRRNLAKLGLIKERWEDPCQLSGKKNPCMWCGLDAVCTIKDQFTGSLTQTFYPDKIMTKLEDQKKSKEFVHRILPCSLTDTVYQILGVRLVSPPELTLTDSISPNFTCQMCQSRI